MEVFYTSPWVPVEWIIAHGHTARGIWAVETDNRAVLPEGICGFAQSLVGWASGSEGGALVATTACDQMRRAADGLCDKRVREAGRASGSLTGNAAVFLLNLPAVWQSPAARRLYQDEIVRLGRFLVELGGVSPTDAYLEQIIHLVEQQKGVLRNYLRNHPARSGVTALTAWLGQGSVPSEAGTERGRDEGVPLAILGGPLPRSHWSFFDAIEQAGGQVVLNATEPGERCLPPPLTGAPGERSPTTWLADHYFDHVVDVFSRPNTRLYEWLHRRLKETRPRGLVLWAEVGCDLWRAEAPSLREAFGLPVLLLDGQGMLDNSPRELNRLSALVESLR